MKLAIILMVMSVMMSGCAAQVPELSQEESALIAEYAVGNLLKYQKNNGSRLVDTKAIEAMQEKEAQLMPEASETETAVEETVSEELPQEAPEIVDNTQQAAYTNIASFLQQEGLDISYNGYEICEKYPGNELDFSVSASMGKLFVVAKFSVTNISEQEIMIDFFSQNIKSRVAVNGNETYRTLTTMLLNDFATYRGAMLAGEGEELVFIIEIPKEQAELLQTMIMTLKTQTASMDIDLIQ